MEREELKRWLIDLVFDEGIFRYSEDAKFTTENVGREKHYLDFGVLNATSNYQKLDELYSKAATDIRNIEEEEGVEFDYICGVLGVGGAIGLGVGRELGKSSAMVRSAERGEGLEECFRPSLSKTTASLGNVLLFDAVTTSGTSLLKLFYTLKSLEESDSSLSINTIDYAYSLYSRNLGAKKELSEEAGIDLKYIADIDDLIHFAKKREEEGKDGLSQEEIEDIKRWERFLRAGVDYDWIKENFDQEKKIASMKENISKKLNKKNTIGLLQLKNEFNCNKEILLRAIDSLPNEILLGVIKSDELDWRGWNSEYVANTDLSKLFIRSLEPRKDRIQSKRSEFSKLFERLVS